jgi:flagellar basal-body rod modification protein FlgD
MSSVSSVSSATTGALSAGGAMGEQQFLQLLVAQLQNQDPLNPVDNSQFVSQLAQFSALQQDQTNGATEQSLLSNNQQLFAETLVGRTVGYSSNGTTVQDTVMGASTTSSGVQLLLESGTSIPLSSVTNTY